MARFDLTDIEWAVIQPLLLTKVRGIKRVDDLRVLNGIFWRLRIHAPWVDIPARYGSHATCVNRFNRWRRAGHWASILQAISEVYDGILQMIHALVDAIGKPIHLKLSAGQAYNGHAALEMPTDLPANCAGLAGRVYDSNAIRQLVAARGGSCCDSTDAAEKPRYPHNKIRYKDRNCIERFLNKLKYFRAVPTRHNKRDDNLMASIQLALIRIWLPSYERGVLERVRHHFDRMRNMRATDQTLLELRDDYGRFRYRTAAIDVPHG